jgi:outer membrane immunogenic protein
VGKYVLTAPVLALAATATPAQAQDFNWTGFYVGAHGAWVDTDADWTGQSIYQTVDGGEGSFTTASQTVPISESLSGSEFGGGGRVGFNWQAGALVLGAEADATFFGFTESVTRTSGGTTYTLVSDASDLETIRARAGLAMGRALIFATGGVAFSGLDHSLSATNVSEIVIDGGEGGDTVGTQTANLLATTSTGTGWTIGGGGEVAVSDNLSVALTLLHVDFGSENLGDSEPPNSIAATVDSTMFVGMFGVNLRF